MAGNNRQRKSSFFSVFNIFKSNGDKHRGRHRYDAHEEGRARKVYPSDEDRGNWGVGDPIIDIRAEDFIAQCKKKVTESETHWQTQAE